MKRTLIIVFWAITYSLKSFSQIDTIYFDGQWKMTSEKRSIKYYRISKKISDSLFSVTDFFLTNRIQMKGFFKDPKTDNSDARNGAFIYYDSIGNITSEGEYINGKKENEWKYYFDNGSKASVRLYSNGLYTGRSVFYDSLTQNIIAEGNYYKDKKDGEWKYYYQNGKISSSCYYSESLYSGKNIYYDSVTGFKTLECNYLNGKRDGQYLLYYRNGNVKVGGSYINGVESSSFNTYDSISGKEIMNGSFDKSNGELVSYYAGTKKIFFKCFLNKRRTERHYMYYDLVTQQLIKDAYVKGEIPIGTWKYYYAINGKLRCVENYDNGLLDGMFIMYDSVSDNKLTRGKYANGKRVGKWEFYYSFNGKLSHEENYKRGVLDGDAYNYDSLGAIITILKFKDGLKHGNWKTFYPDTKRLWIDYNFKEDSLDGELTTYFETGKLKRREEYQMGKLFSSKCYTILGEETLYYPVMSTAQFEKDAMTYIGDNLNYPAKAKANGIEGKVLVRFAVNENGKVSDAEVIQGIDKECDAEALQLVSQMPSWKPAEIDGMPYKTYQTLPIVFWIH